jgi:hypothetical protein
MKGQETWIGKGNAKGGKKGHERYSRSAKYISVQRMVFGILE